MFAWLRAKSPNRRIAEELYERIVAQARTPALYADLGVPDTIDGRFEMIVLHVVLVLERLAALGVEGALLGQALTEALVRDLDDAMRQIGLGGDSIVHRMKRLPAVLAECRRDYTQALASTAARSDWAGEPQPDALVAALSKHGLLATGASPEPRVVAARLAEYVREAHRSVLASAPANALAGHIEFPPAATTADFHNGATR